MQKPCSGPLLLCIVDGFGVAPPAPNNAISEANTPTLDRLFANYPHSTLVTHGEAVGLPVGQMGNSEVGHMSIGSGRVIKQSLQQISDDFASGDLFKTPGWQDLSARAKVAPAVHVVGLVSDGGLHSHMDHISALCQHLPAREIFIHAMTDGRDTPVTVAAEQLAHFSENLPQHAKIATISGRFYGMDRDQNHERIAVACDLITKGTGSLFTDIAAAVTTAYDNGDTDEFLPPFVCDGYPGIGGDDLIIMMNFRADRMRQITQALSAVNGNIVTLTEYDSRFDFPVLFPKQQPTNTLGEVVARAGGQQLRIAESDKYAHVTFFLNGGREHPFAGEDRIVVPSPKVKTYAEAPAMSLPEITEKLCAAMQDKPYDLIVLNIANGDQVGHSGQFDAAVEAVEHIDAALGKITDTLAQLGGEMVLIADHGNCEQMTYPDGAPHAAHTTHPVPLLYVGRPAAVQPGILADVAPTLLSLLGLDAPAEMTGSVLIS